jgi:predicted ribosome quality control (RQC) complex YloA/Tae2 family protein
LSTKELVSGDLWFHAQRCPGSHVLLKATSGTAQFEQSDILYAASLAAAHSRAKADLKVEVMVAEAKDVKKPAGAKPGMVTVRHYKTLMVKPLSENTQVF